jgi:hypothetical protein
MRQIRIAKTLFLRALAASLVALASLARSQGAPQLTGQITEEFGGVRGQSAPIGLVVGVIQGPAGGRADLRSLRALMPMREDASSVCFSATTFDSVYSATGSLHAKSGSGGASRIGDPPFPQRNDELRRYPSDELAISLVLSANCNLLREKPLTLVPATFGGPSNIVRVALNTRPPEKLVVTLTSAKSATAVASCKALDELSAKSFQYVCDFRLEPSFGGGTTTLAVTRKMPGVRESMEVFKLLVQDPAVPIVERSR